jgi:Domain of unknown function (DUF397)
LTIARVNGREVALQDASTLARALSAKAAEELIDGMTWRTPSRSGSNSENRVEMARVERRTIAARDSKNPNGPILRFGLLAIRASSRTSRPAAMN